MVAISSSFESELPPVILADKDHQVRHDPQGDANRVNDDVPVQRGHLQPLLLD
jgi:hypothetical protein